MLTSLQLLQYRIVLRHWTICADVKESRCSWTRRDQKTIPAVFLHRWVILVERLRLYPASGKSINPRSIPLSACYHRSNPLVDSSTYKKTSVAKYELRIVIVQFKQKHTIHVLQATSSNTLPGEITHFNNFHPH